MDKLYIKNILDKEFKLNNSKNKTCKYTGFPLNKKIPKIHSYKLNDNEIYPNYISGEYYYFSFKNENKQKQKFMNDFAIQWFNNHKDKDIDIIFRIDNIIKSAKPIEIDDNKKYNIKLKLN